MCGFGGVINHYDQLTTNKVGTIAAAVNFRGPDSCGIRILNDELKEAPYGRNAFFFNRLAIIDLDDRSNQPFEDERHLLTFNGEIYNYHELKTSLEKKGVIFKTTSDTEVLFFALKLWGTDALERLNGMFAFSWLDKQEKTLMICRDRLGIKPLYYCTKEGSFYFSSELSSIVRLMPQKPPVASASVDMYLWMQFVPTPYSILEDIQKLPPGTYIKVSIDSTGTSLIPTTYWNVYKAVSDKKYHAEAGQLEAILKDSLQRQLHADVPIGLFLSSGVDSSLLAAIVNKYFSQDKEVNFFTISFNENTFTDESSDAIQFINGFKNPNLKNHLLDIDPALLMDHLFCMYDFYDEPFGDYASLLNWIISIKAREHVTVALSGDGADELYWGYSRYNKWQDHNKISSIPIASSVIRGASSILPSSSIKEKIQRGV